MYKYIKSKVPATSKTGMQPSKAISEMTQEHDKQLLVFEWTQSERGSWTQRCASMPLENGQDRIITFSLLLSVVLR